MTDDRALGLEKGLDTAYTSIGRFQRCRKVRFRTQDIGSWEYRDLKQGRHYGHIRDDDAISLQSIRLECKP